jgi:leucine dehydrogenase
MDVFASPAFDDHEQVVFFFDRATGLKAIVALHDTRLGPAIGGCRMWPYASETEALTDVLRLARGMTYKAAMASLPFGGDKTVVIGDPKADKSEALFRALGRAIDSLGGRYYTGEDVGTSPADVADLDPARVERAADEFGARVVAGDQILGVEADVLAPCALGGVINDRTLPRLSCAIVAGAANNQLLEDRHGAALHARGILYAPDYVINAGGLINIAEELRPRGYQRERALARVQSIAQTLTEVFERAGREGAPTNQIADRIAAERLRLGRQSRAALAVPDALPVRAAAG